MKFSSSAFCQPIESDLGREYRKYRKVIFDMCRIALKSSVLGRKFHPFRVGVLFKSRSRGFAELNPWLLELHPFRMRDGGQRAEVRWQRSEIRAKGASVRRWGGRLCAAASGTSLGIPYHRNVVVVSIRKALMGNC